MSGAPVAVDVVPEDWASLAFHKEKTQARRIAASIGITFSDALQQVLMTTALPRSIAELVADRQNDIARKTARRTLRKQQQADAFQRKQAMLSVSPTHWYAWFDGSASPNPGRIGIGGVIRSPQGEFAEISRAIGVGDSSEAEYLALIAVLELVAMQRAKNLVVFGDSRIVIDDVTGVHLASVLTEYRLQAQSFLECIGNVSFCWIPRAKNARADGLATRRSK